MDARAVTEAMAQLGAAAKRAMVSMGNFTLATDPEYEAERAASQWLGEVPPSREVFAAERDRRESA